MSEIALGTVELGMDYGFYGGTHSRKPEEKDAITLIHHALDQGINLIDTAPVYGTSEEIIGKAIKSRKGRPYIATKIMVPEVGCSKDLISSIWNSIERSLRTLCVDTIDVLQIHNTNLMISRGSEVVDCVERARQQGKVRFIGASTYNENESLQALEQESRIDCLQVPLNILNQTMTRQVLPAALKRGKGTLVRSVFLRGILTSQMDQAPNSMEPLKKMAIRAFQELSAEVQSLPEGALRFCLSIPGVSSALIGVRSRTELDDNLAASAKGALPAACLESLLRFSMDNEPMANPANWTNVI